MIDLSRLRSTDVGRAVAYVSATDALLGRLCAWNGKVAYIEFETLEWTDFPRYSRFICAPVFPEHLRFAPARDVSRSN